jgi:hypothetical protein
LAIFSTDLSQWSWALLPMSSRRSRFLVLLTVGAMRVTERNLAIGPASIFGALPPELTMTA